MWMRMRMAKTGLMETMMVSIKHGDVLVMYGIYVTQSNETKPRFSYQSKKVFVTYLRSEA